MPWRKLLNTRFMIRLLNWEYWPFGIVQFPLFFYYPWLSLRAGSFTFFSASNPGILMGGMFGESKFDVLRLVPANLAPKTILIREGTTFGELTAQLNIHKLSYPLIFKPDVGERGHMVKRINDNGDAKEYLARMPHAFLVQELVSKPLEFGVFYARKPQWDHGKVTSVVMKEMLSVTGDGSSTLEQLILNSARAKLQWPVLQATYRDQLNDVLTAGTKLEIVSIGNHCLGTKFINANHLICDELNSSFDRISRSIPGFHFGRFDLRCDSLEDLRRGNVSILELNGCGAEPAHIYDPSFSFFRAVGVLINHWKTIFDIARANKRSGASYLPLHEAIAHYRNFKSKTKPQDALNDAVR